MVYYTLWCITLWCIILYGVLLYGILYSMVYYCRIKCCNIKHCCSFHFFQLILAKQINNELQGLPLWWCIRTTHLRSSWSCALSSWRCTCAWSQLIAHWLPQGVPTECKEWLRTHLPSRWTTQHACIHKHTRTCIRCIVCTWCEMKFLRTNMKTEQNNFS